MPDSMPLVSWFYGRQTTTNSFGAIVGRSSGLSLGDLVLTVGAGESISGSERTPYGPAEMITFERITSCLIKQYASWFSEVEPATARLVIAMARADAESARYCV